MCGSVFACWECSVINCVCLRACVLVCFGRRVGRYCCCCCGYELCRIRSYRFVSFHLVSFHLGSFRLTLCLDMSLGWVGLSWNVALTHTYHAY